MSAPLFTSTVAHSTVLTALAGKLQGMAGDGTPLGRRSTKTGPLDSKKGEAVYETGAIQLADGVRVFVSFYVEKAHVQETAAAPKPAAPAVRWAVCQTHGAAHREGEKCPACPQVAAPAPKGWTHVEGGTVTSADGGTKVAPSVAPAVKPAKVRKVKPAPAILAVAEPAPTLAAPAASPMASAQERLFALMEKQASGMESLAARLAALETR